MIIIKSREQKTLLYEEKYSHIPRDYNERLEYLYTTLNLNPYICADIIEKRNNMINTLEYTQLKIILYEDPEGSPRPRFRLVNRQNFMNQALTNPSFVHVYSITGASDQRFMKRLISENDFFNLGHLIYTPCDIIIDIFKRTPSNFNRIDTVLSEIGLIRPPTKPDWDNAGKKYSDMFNSNIWLDDNLVISGLVQKFYSILPRVEITLEYLNMLYNKQQAVAISRSLKEPIDIQYFGNNKGEIL